MTSASPSLAAAEPKLRKFGTYSFVLAALAFAVFTAMFGVYTNVPSPGTETARWLVQWFAIVGFLGILTLMELAGIVLGIAACSALATARSLGRWGQF
jgi:hypothetical protein